ncbi:hypothetical protein HET73_05760 [Wolbachia endosymbiont of Atemnus politus]|uniref:hypothetical protein n=1 Tax=Wolbachia endosymbiont of Atemnus politus TaxID=2682840 RepID=UPI0015725768|nr:hypothetical protein [Wolbachia endosymbiont of Atemnus politus]NSM56863.1 hypothetical protein [Wolbachia endosymbiont of Atemnus politus]
MCNAQTLQFAGVAGGVIPVLDQPFTIKNIVCNIGLAIFALTNLMPNRNSWIPVSGHWDDTLSSGYCSQIKAFMLLK